MGFKVDKMCLFEFLGACKIKSVSIHVCNCRRPSEDSCFLTRAARGNQGFFYKQTKKERSVLLPL